MINKRMQRAIDTLGVPDRAASIRLTPELHELARSRLIEVEGCFFLEALLHRPFDIASALAQSFDRTELECSVNEVSIGDFLEERSLESLSPLLEQGILYACALVQNLNQKGDFTVVVSFSAPGLTEDAEFPSCVVQFYANRLDEIVYLSSDLEGYQDAILTLQTLDEPDGILVDICRTKS